MEGISVVKAGTQACAINTEHELVADAAGGVYAVLYDTSALASGDTLQVTAYVRTSATAAWRLVDQRSLTGAQTVPMKDLDGRAVVGPHGARFTVKQTAGTGRSIPYVITKVSP